jgi:hypothetical protein
VHGSIRAGDDRPSFMQFRRLKFAQGGLAQESLLRVANRGWKIGGGNRWGLPDDDYSADQQELGIQAQTPLDHLSERSVEMICVESIPTDGNLFGLRAGNGLCSRSSREARSIIATRVPLSVTIRGVTRASRTNRPVALWSCRIVIVLITRLLQETHIIN